MLQRAPAYKHVGKMVAAACAEEGAHCMYTLVAPLPYM